jgi:tryptophan synthase alpha chain
MNRIDRKFQNLRSAKEKALAVFVTAGYPRVDSTAAIIRALEEGGADLVELGMPYSDPLADGPVIQQSSAAALANGVTLESILADVRMIRSSSDLPIVLMGYLNPILRFGEESFFLQAAAAGVDGMILPEIPLEEFGRFSDLLQAQDLAGILLVTPATGGDRIRAIDEKSSGFLYCVSTTGVTGMHGGNGVDDYLKRVRDHVRKNPLMVGFGIATPDDARRFGTSVDGVIVGSAFIRFLATDPSPEAIGRWAREFKRVLQP